MILGLDHIAIAVDDFEGGIERFARDFGIECVNQIDQWQGRERGQLVDAKMPAQRRHCRDIGARGLQAADQLSEHDGLGVGIAVGRGAH